MILAGLFLSLGVRLWAIDEDEVLVVYNSQESDSLAVASYYQSVRTGVRTLDLNEGTLLPGTISYADFISKVRDPIRSHLNSNNLEESVLVIVLTKGLPHRIQQISPNTPDLGDTPSAASTAYGEGNITYASVDSELTLLQFDLEEGEAGGNEDSPADRAIYNPYYRETDSIDSYDRSEITSEDRYFEANAVGYNYGLGYIQREGPFGASRNVPIDAGHIYLTARLDADSVEDVKAMIDRAQNIVIRRQTDALLFDADARTTKTVDDEVVDVRLQYIYDPIVGDFLDDYEEAEDLFGADWDRLQYDHSTDYFRGETDTISFSATEVPISGPVAHLNSYGTNHTGSGERDYLSSYAGQLVPGASFAAYESYGASGLGGVSPPLNQAQITEWIAAGGTFATGPAWEPFTFGISRSEVFLNAFYNEGLTYVEAAWSSIMQLSWQSVVLGDPLATASIIDAEDYYVWALENTGTTPTVSDAVAEDADFDDDQILNGVEYGFDLDPTAYSVSPVSAPTLSASGNPEFVLEIPDGVPSEVTYILERSLTMDSGSWSSIAEWSESAGASGSAGIGVVTESGVTTLTITDSEELEDGEKAFYRLSVEW
ncbi:MAG: hypothetical protein ACQKBT_04700 [Puniceicoccales bacterium]